jgi:hypothetical protein
MNYTIDYSVDIKFLAVIVGLYLIYAFLEWRER